MITYYSLIKDPDETMMTIHINADLRPVLGEKVGTLHWIMDPAVSGFIIGYDLSDNQVLICNFDVRNKPRNFSAFANIVFLSPKSTQSNPGTTNLRAALSAQRLARTYLLTSSVIDPGS